MPLFCAFGWHDPEPVPRWNRGYYFTICRRCRCDLVRTAYGRWQIPRGYRVVWQALPPADELGVEMVRDEGPDLSGTAGLAAPTTELPIMEVLRGLESETAEEPTAAPIEPPPTGAPDPAREVVEEAEKMESITDAGAAQEHASAPSVPQRSDVPDFMGENGAAVSPQLRARMTGTAEEQEGRPAAALSRKFAAYSAGMYGRVRDRFSATGRSFRSGALGAIVHQRRTAEGRRPIQRGMIASVAITILLLIALVFAVQRGTNAPEGNGARAEAPAPPLMPLESAFVTASVLNCHSAPARQAAVVKRLIRGDTVQIMARDDNWASVSHEGRQCWASLRYLSLSRPL